MRAMLGARIAVHRLGGVMKLKRAFFSLCLMALAMDAQAGLRDIYAANDLLLVQVSSTRVDYREYGNGYLGTAVGLLDQETGSVPGLSLAASGIMVKEGNLYWQAHYGYSSGYTHYTGSLQGGTFGSYVGVSSAVLVDYGARMGQAFAVRDAFMLIPYFELGSHEWDRGVNYGEIYTHFYYGPGLLVEHSPADRVVLSINALYGRTAGSHIVANSGPLMNGFSGALGNSVLSRVGVAADYAFNAEVHGKVAIEYTRFRYGMSAAFPVGGNIVAWEPDSTTRYIVFKAGVGVAF